ncbi:MAG: T9SS type A sorting domain-containing protein [Bacteroidales bacterium]|nr:T9SS type A sorting domain-containing protein [Bacteroidales bacterium]
MKKLFYAAVILLLSHTVAAQSFSGQYDWVKFFAGYERDYYPSQGIYCTEVDDSGYVYYYGSFGDVCTQGLYGLEGRFDTTLTEEMYRQGKYNVFIAKYDTLGNRLWMREVSSDYQARPGWMELHGDTLYLLGTCGMYGNASWLWFFDTMIRMSDFINTPASTWRPPYTSRFNFFTKMDLDGNVLNTIYMQCQDRAGYHHNTYYDTWYYSRQSPTTLFGKGPVAMHVDKTGCLYLVLNCGWTGVEDSAYSIITYNGDSTYRSDFLLPYNFIVGDSGGVGGCSRPMMYKFDANGRLLWHKFVAFESEGIPAMNLSFLQRTGIWDTCAVQPEWNMVFSGFDADEDDNLYLSGYFNNLHPATPWSGGIQLEYEYPARIFFDSAHTHYAQMNHFAEAYAQSHPFIAKFDTSGAVQWVHEPHFIYNDRHNYQTYNHIGYSSVTASDSSVYVLGGISTLFDEDTIFFGNGQWFERGGDSERHHRYPLFLRLDKATGQCVNYGTHYCPGWWDDDGVSPAAGMTCGGSFQRHFVHDNRLYASIAYQISPTEDVSFMAIWQTDRRVADTMRIHCLGLWDYHFYPRPGNGVLFDYTLRSHDITLDTFFFTNPRASGSAAAFGMFREDRPHTMLEQFIDWEQDLRFTLADSPVAMTATATSGLPVSYSSGDSTVATVDGSTLRLHRVGEVQITATQEGDADYLPAPPITRTVIVRQDTVGILSADEDGGIRAYPNPFTNHVEVYCGSNKIVSAYLTDMQGRREEVRLTATGNGQYTLDLTSRPPATYLLTVTTADGRQITLRLLKQSDIFSR